MVRTDMDNQNINIPIWPCADEKEESAINRVLQSACWWRNGGTETKKFETEFAKYQDCINGVSVANGTIAIEAALKALDIGSGDEVIVPDFTFYSTVSAVLSVGAVSVIVDVSPETFCIDADEVEAAITDKTKAVIVVHMAGNISDMDRLQEIAKKHNVHLIEDAAHAHGAEWNGKKAGSFGTVGTFSFQNAKLMTAGEGGMITGNDADLLNRLFLEVNCGRAEGDTDYEHVLIGTNARLSEFQGAILRVQLQRLPEQIAVREKNYQYLVQRLETIQGIKVQTVDSGMTRHPHYMIMFYYDSEQFNGATRMEFIQYLKTCKLPVNRAYKAIHELPIFAMLPENAWRFGGNGISCPHTKDISENVVCLAHNILLGDESLMDYIVECITKFKNR